MQSREQTFGDYLISTDPAKLDIDVIHRFLTESSYWATERPIEIVRKSIEHSLCFGVYANDGQQVGFARAVSDFATFAWICDVFILEPHRGRGLSKLLMEYIVSYPELQGLKRLLLATRDAHELYRRYGGFELVKNPQNWLERSTIEN